MSWLNEWIGRPYRFGGRGPEYDCYGLVMAVYRAHHGIDLPDWIDIERSDLIGRAGQIQDVVTSGTWTRVEHAEGSCFVMCYRKRAAYHMGLFYDGGVIHCTESHGVVYEPLARFIPQYPLVEFGRWAP